MKHSHDGEDGREAVQHVTNSSLISFLRSPFPVSAHTHTHTHTHTQRETQLYFICVPYMK